MRIGRREYPSPLLVFFAVTPVIGRWILWWIDHLGHQAWHRLYVFGLRSYRMLWWTRHLRHQAWSRLSAFGVRAYEWTLVHVFRRELR